MNRLRGLALGVLLAFEISCTTDSGGAGTGAGGTTGSGGRGGGAAGTSGASAGTSGGAGNVGSGGVSTTGTGGASAGTSGGAGTVGTGGVNTAGTGGGAGTSGVGGAAGSTAGTTGAGGAATGGMSGGTGGDAAGGAGGADPRCPGNEPLGGPSCRIPEDAGAFCTYGAGMMCVCNSSGATTGAWFCFGGTGGSTGGAGTTGTAGTTGEGGTTGTGGAGGSPPPTPCPATLPTSGTCRPDGRLCTYGTATRPECRDHAICTSGSWLGITAGCPASLTTGCPAVAPEVGQTVTCTGAMADGYCRYTTGNGVECKCVGNAVTGGVFVCNRPTPPPTPCPAALPNAGTACGTTTQSCAYPCGGQLSSTAVTATCSGGSWSWAQSSCTAP